MLDLLLLLAEEGWKTQAIHFIAEWSYVGVFTLLVICGLGFPCPEEVALIGGGYAVYQAGLSDPAAGGVEAVALMCVVAMCGVLIGDSLIWMIGRFAGDRAHKIPMLGRHLSPDRMEKARAMFQKHGAKAVFFGRFLFGVRAVTFLVAGSMRVPLPVFLLMDGLAGLISVPTSIVLAWYFGEHLHSALAAVGQLNQAILVVVGVIAIVLIALFLRARRRAREEQREAEETVAARHPVPAHDEVVGLDSGEAAKEAGAEEATAVSLPAPEAAAEG